MEELSCGGSVSVPGLKISKCSCDPSFREEQISVAWQTFTGTSDSDLSHSSELPQFSEIGPKS